MTVDSGRILVLAHLFFIVSLTRPWLKLLLGFHGKMLFEGKYVIPGGTTYYSEWNCKMDIYKGVIQETTHCEGEHVSTMFIHPKKDNTYMLFKSKKP